MPCNEDEQSTGFVDDQYVYTYTNTEITHTDIRVMNGMKYMEKCVLRKHPKEVKQLFDFHQNLFAFVTE